MANKAGVTFEDDLGTSTAWLRLLTLTGHATAADASKATFKGNVYLRTGANGGLVLGQNTGVTFNGTDSQTVAGNITSASGGNYGTITIDNDDGVNDGVTFKGALGASGTNNGLDRLTLSDNSEATFESHVYLANGLKLGDRSLITFGGSGNQTIQAGIGNSRRDRRGSVVVNNDGTTNNNIVSFEDAVGASGGGNDLARLTVRDGVAQFKRDVFAQGLEVSSTDGAEFKGNVTTGGISFVGNDAAQITLNGAANQTVTGDITTESNGRGRLVVNNAGTTNNKVTFAGRIGADRRALQKITLSAGQTTFNDDVYAGSITIDTGDATVFKRDVKAGTGIQLGDGSSVTLNGTAGQTITGNITSASGGDYGTITVANTHADGVSFKGSLGASGDNSGLSRVTLNTNARAAFGGNVYLENGLTFGNGSQVTFNGTGSQTVAGDLTSAAGGNYGGISIDNDDGVTFKGALGASGTNNGLDRLTLSRDSEATFEGNVYLANGLRLGDRSLITFGGSGNQTIKAGIGNSRRDRRGSVVVDNDGTTNRTVSFEGAVGASGAGNDLARLTVRDGVAQFKRDVFAQSVRVSSTDGAEFKGNVTTGGISFTGNDAAQITLNGAANQTVTGDITTESNGRGRLVVNNAGTTNNKVTFAGRIGADRRALQKITLSAGQTTFNDDVYAGSITIDTGDATVFKRDVKAGTGIQLGDGSSVTLNGTAGQTITGNITSASGGDYGTITVANTHADGVSFKGNLGASGDNSGLSRVTLNTNARAAFGGNVYLENGLTFGNGSQVTFNGTGSQTVAGDLKSAAGGNYGGISIDNDDGVTFKGALGASGTNNGLDRLTLSDDSEATLEGHVYLANGLKLGDGSFITFGGSGNQIIQAGITNSTAGERGSVIVNNDGATNRTVSFEDAVGASGAGNGLAGLTVRDGVAQFKRDVFAQGLEVSSTDGAEFKGNVTTGGISFTGNDAAQITLNGTANQTVTGDITTRSNGRGRLVVNNAGTTNNKVTFAGRIGADRRALQKITLSAGQTTFNDDVYAGSITIDTGDATVFKRDVKADRGVKLGDGSSVTLNGTAGQTITGNITSASGGDYGTITVANTHADGVSFKGSLGASGNNNGLSRVTLNNNARAAFGGNVYLENGLTFGNGSQVTFNGTGSQTVAGDLTSAAGGNYGGISIDNDDGVTFKGALGTNSAKLNSLTLSRDSEATFAGNVYLANGLKLGDRSLITFGGSGNQTIKAGIGNSRRGRRGSVIVDNDGTTNKTVSFEGAVGASGNDLAGLTVRDGVAVFKGDVFAQGLEVSSTDGAEFRGDVTTGALGILFAGNDAAQITLNGTANQTVTGDITTESDGRGRLVVNNAGTTNNKVTFGGRIGADRRVLKQITLRDGETTFGGDVYAGNLNITASDATTFRGHVKADREFELGDGSSVTFGGTAGQTVTGNITGAANGNGTIIIDNVHADGVTFGGQLGTAAAQLDSLTVNEGAKVTFTRPVYLSGTLRLKTGTTIALGDGLTTRSDATQPFVTVGDYAFDGDFTEANKVRLILPLSFTKGTQKVFSAHSTLDKEKFTLNGNNLVRYNYEFNNDGTAVTVTAQGFKTLGEVSSKLGTTDTESSMILTVSSFAKKLPTGDPVKKIIEEATRAGNEAQGRRLAAQLKPQMTALGGARRAVLSTGRQVAGMISEHLALQRGEGRRSGLAQSGFATGGDGLDKSFWFKPFGRRGKQANDRIQNIDAYGTSARGLAMGVDAPVGERGRVGTALAYSTSRITGEGVAQDKTGVRGWQVLVYGDYSTAHYYVEGQVGVGRNDVRTTSRVAVLTRKAAYDTTSLTASVGGGVPINLDAGTTLTPTAGLSWTRVGSANYTTTGALSLNQKITVGAIDAVVGTLGTRLQKEITRWNGTLVPVARAGLSYDFAGEQTMAHGRFTGGGNRFTVKGAKVKKFSGTAGVGLSYNAPRWSIGADYDLNARTGYTGHSARLNAKVKF